MVLKLTILITTLLLIQFSAEVSIPPPARAVTVTVEYDPNDPKGVNPCDPIQTKACADGVNQTPQALAGVEAAVAFWTDVFEDDHEMTILVSWLNDLSGLPEAIPEETDDQGRVTVGRVRFPPNRFFYFYDQTPTRDEEFLGQRTDNSSQLLSGMMRPKLKRTLHPAEKAEAFQNSGSEIVEVGYNGLAQPYIAVDFLTLALHEVGHIFGLKKPVLQCNENVIPSGYIPPLILTGGEPLGIKACQFTSQEFTGVLKDRGILISMDGIGRWRDNVFVERLWRRLKYEEVYLHAYETVRDVQDGMARYLTFYNQLRPHRALDGRTPERMYSDNQPARPTAA